MITTEEAKKLVQGSYIHFDGECKRTIGPRGGVKEHSIRFKVGKIKTWKRSPQRVEFSVIHGLKGYNTAIFDEFRTSILFHREEDCPLNKTTGEIKYPLREEIMSVFILDETFKDVKWSEVNVNQEVYLRGTQLGKPRAYGPHKVFDPIGMELKNQSGKIFPNYQQNLLVKI